MWNWLKFNNLGIFLPPSEWEFLEGYISEVCSGWKWQKHIFKPAWANKRRNWQSLSFSGSGVQTMLSDSVSFSLNSVGFLSTVCWIFLRCFLFTFWQGWLPGAPGLSLLMLRLRKRGEMIRPGCSLGVQGIGRDRKGRFASRRPIFRGWHQALIPWPTIKTIPFSTILTPLPFSLSHIFKNTDIPILLGHCPHPCYKEHKLIFKTQEIV